MTTTYRTTTAVRLGIAVGAAALALAGCGDADTTDDAASAAGSGSAEAAASVTISDAWVKAADEGMSAAFGELSNDGAEDATIVSVATDASPMIELHETVESGGEMQMQEIDGGFVVPADGELSLEPGGNHIMLMDLTDPLEAGDEVAFTLTFADDSTLEVTAPVKDYSGANESYEGGDEEMEDMDHEDMDH